MFSTAYSKPVFIYLYQERGQFVNISVLAPWGFWYNAIVNVFKSVKIDFISDVVT